MSVTVEVDTGGSLLSVGQGSREAAGAVQEIVQASGELGVVGDLGSDLGRGWRPALSPIPLPASPLVVGLERPVLEYRPRLGTKLCR